MDLRFSLALLLLTMLTTQCVFGQDKIPENSRIIFLGDSITQAGARPNGYISIVRREIEKELPGKNIEIIGAGISGNRVPDLQKRLERDVLSKKPTLVFIYIGINDVWHSEQGRGTPKSDFEAGLLDIITKIKDAGAKVILCTPSTIGEKSDGSNRLDTMLEEYSGISRKIATATNSQLLDLRKRFLDHLRSNNRLNRERNILTGDGVHLNAAGNDFVAAQMLSALNVTYECKQANSVLRHIVMMKFNDDVDVQAKDRIVDAFADLPNKIDTIIDYEAGTNTSPEGLDQGFTHSFVVTFRDSAGRDIYLPHPAHKAFVELLAGKIDKVLVFDFQTGS